MMQSSIKYHLEHLARVRPGYDGLTIRSALSEIEKLQEFNNNAKDIHSDLKKELGDYIEKINVAEDLLSTCLSHLIGERGYENKSAIVLEVHEYFTSRKEARVKNPYADANNIEYGDPRYAKQAASEGANAPPVTQVQNADEMLSKYFHRMEAIRKTAVQALGHQGCDSPAYDALRAIREMAS